jgi:hypothetical protein
MVRASPKLSVAGPREQPDNAEDRCERIRNNLNVQALSLGASD